MLRMRRRDTLKMALAAPFWLAAGRAQAQATTQAWPSRPVQIIMGFGAGGGADTMTRVVFQKVSEILGQPMVVENRTGGNSVVAATAVLGLPRDGHAFLVNGAQQLVNPLLIKDLQFDYRTAFTPITKLCNYPQALSVAADAPWKTMQELVAYAKANPGKIRYGTSGVGGIPHIIGESLQTAGGVKFVNVPYRVAPEMLRDVAGGQLDMTILTISTTQPMLQAGKVRVIGVGNATRAKILPNVPTLAEAGLGDANLADWSGLFAATGVPDAILRRMQAAVAEASRDPAVVAKLDAAGTELVADTPAVFNPFLEKERALVTRVIRDANIKLE